MKQIFSCTVVFKPKCAVAYLDGELDMFTVRCLVSRLTPLAVEGRDIVLDVSGLRFLGVAALRALADLQGRATAAGGSVRLAQPPALLSRVLAVAGMQDAFTIDSPHWQF
jgi:anti-sigma B factor antagonist